MADPKMPSSESQKPIYLGIKKYERGNFFVPQSELGAEGLDVADQQIQENLMALGEKIKDNKYVYFHPESQEFYVHNSANRSGADDEGKIAEALDLEKNIIRPQFEQLGYETVLIDHDSAGDGLDTFLVVKKSKLEDLKKRTGIANVEYQ